MSDLVITGLETLDTPAQTNEEQLSTQHPESLSLSGHCLLDWFGHVIDHDPLSDRLVRRPYQPEMKPGLTLLAVRPLQSESTGILRKKVSLPCPVPELRLIEAEPGLMGLQVKETGLWFSIHAENDKTRLTAPALQDWEKFTLLTEEMFKGLELLASPHLAELRDAAGNIVPAFHMEESVGRAGGKLGDFIFVPAYNQEALARLGQLASYASTNLTFTTPEGKKKTFAVTRLT